MAKVIELISSGVKTQSDLQAMILGLKSRIIESALNGEMNYHLSRLTTVLKLPYQDNVRGKLVLALYSAE